ncbi:MAG: hypothetical protein ACJASK_002104 [Ilumatobacter sp.]|jgi:hypothetical protein
MTPDFSSGEELTARLAARNIDPSAWASTWPSTDVPRDNELPAALHVGA